VNRLIADEPESLHIAFMRDTLLSALCVLNGAFSVLAIDDFVRIVDRFLPAICDTQEIGEVYAYLCRSYGSASAETQKIYFRFLVQFSCLQRRTADFIRREVIELGVYLQMFEILMDCLARCDDAEAAVAAFLGGSRAKIDDFREFMAVLGQLATVQRSWS
jgi:hypothetical protein